MSVSVEQLKAKFQAIPEIDNVSIDSDGHHYRLTIVSDHFVDQSKIARQKWVYGILKDMILSGDLHAIEMQTWTKSEWEKQHG